MIFIEQEIAGVFLVQRKPFVDQRGSFSRLFCKEELKKFGLNFDIDQINLSINVRQYTLRGFHIQKAPNPEGKLLTVLSGEIFNVVIDLRSNSETYLKWRSFNIKEDSDLGLIVPEGCANAFLTLKDNTQVLYFMDGAFHPDSGFSIRYNDPLFDIPWPTSPKVISDKDLATEDFDPATWT
jgi:dTDP-4-dehydrorhamnose 3,5-epimerase